MKEKEWEEGWKGVFEFVVALMGMTVVQREQIEINYKLKEKEGKETIKEEKVEGKEEQPKEKETPPKQPSTEEF